MRLGRNDDWSLIMSAIFRRVFPVWKRFTGDVPKKGLTRLDLSGDFPRGLAEVAIKRLNRDTRLQKQCERFFG
jgi:hypothetical protein